MSEGPWIRFFSSDWLAGTRGMTAAETGIYITLIAMMYERGGPIKNEPSRLARLCGASNSSFKKALETLVSEGKIMEDDGLLSNGRVVEELFYCREKSAVARAKAKSRWGQKDNKNKGGEDAAAMPQQSRGNANQNQSQKKKKTDANASAKEKPEARGARLPDDWQPSFDPFVFGEDAGLSPMEVEAQIPRFRDYWRGKAGKDARKLDWDATFRNWLRKAGDDKRTRAPPRNSSGGPTPWQRQMQAFDEVFDERCGERSPTGTVLSLPSTGTDGK